jgi:putative transposase
MERLFRRLQTELFPATGYIELREAKRDINYYLMITTTGGVRINTMTEYRQQKPKIALTDCPDLFDHYRLKVGVCSRTIYG